MKPERPGTARPHGRAVPGLLLALGLAAPVWCAPGGPIFEEAGESAGLDFLHDNGASGELYLPEIMGPGGALFDYDGDGDMDVYLVQGHRLGGGGEHQSATDRLYRNDLLDAPVDASANAPADATVAARPRFVDVTDAAGISGSAYGIGAATGDFDNDGWTDLYVSNLGSNQLLHNNGDGTFSEVTSAAGVQDDRWSVTATFFDYDADGWLDLWVVNYLDFSIARRKHCLSPTGAADYCDPNAYEPVSDSLFRNRGDGTFERVSTAAGIDKVEAAGLGIVTADFDRDGWLDAYVANDGQPNQLYLNNRDGTFREDALFAGCGVSGEGASEASMGAVAGDVDNDGDEDLLLTHLSKETNTLYVNDGTGFFKDETEVAGLGVPSWNYTGFGTGFLDFDSDGLLDLVVVNGAVTFFAGGAQRRLDQPNQLYRNVGGGRFVPVGSEADGPLTRVETSRGALLGDLDNDGDTDLIVLNNAGPARVLLNRRADGEGWLGLRLTDRSSGRDLLGTLAQLGREGGANLGRRSHTDGGYASARDPRIVFGLGPSAENSEPPTAAIRLPRGAQTRFEALRHGRYSQLYLGESQAPKALQ